MLIKGKKAMKMFYRVFVVTEADTNEEIKFSFDFESEFEAARFATMAFLSETAYDRVYIDILEYDEKDMTTTDSPCWKNIKI
jgi:hypothetical protein